MDIQGRTQPSYRPRGSEEGEPPAVTNPTAPIGGVVAPSTPQQQPSTPAQTVDSNVITGGAVPQTHKSDDVTLEKIIQDVQKDPKLAPDQPNEKTVATNEQKPKDSNTPKKQSKMPIMVAIVALLIAGGLAVTAYFAFSGNRAEENGNVKVNQVNKPTVNEEATPDSVDKTSQEVSQEIDALQDSQEFDANELGDQQLGL